MARVAALLLLAVVLSGCDSGAERSGNTLRRPGEPPITTVDDEDPKMVAAIQQARDTADQFIQALQHPQAAMDDFSVKVPFVEGDGGEHMWLRPVRFENGKFIGILGNEPSKVTRVKLGDEITVAKGEISDWMYIEDGKLRGGYTLRVLRDLMPADERKDFDESIPFKIE